MELNKSILITFLLSSYLLFSVEAAFSSSSEVLDSKYKHKYFLITSNSPAPSPTPEVIADGSPTSEVLDLKHNHEEKYFLMTSNSPASSPSSETTFKRYLLPEVTDFPTTDVLNLKQKHDSKYSFMASNSPAPSPASQTTFKRGTGTTIIFPNFPTTSTTINIDPKLKSICAITENPMQCISFIAPYLTGSINANSALQVVIQRLYILVKDASSIALQLRSKASTSLMIKKSIDNSLELYEKALNNLEKASIAFSIDDFEKVNNMLGASISNFGYCNEAFQKRGIDRWPMQKVNDLLIEFAGFGVDISTKLVTGN